MRFVSRHPELDQLSDFLAGSTGESRARIVAHLGECQACRDSFQFLRGVAAAAEEIPMTGPSEMLLARVLASRAADTRIILPVTDATNRAARRWLLPAVAAMLLAVLGGTIVTRKIPSPEEEGLIAWYAYATNIDSAAAARWRTRLLRDAPTNSYAVQWRLIAVLDSLRTRKDTAQALRRMDALWADAPRERRVQVANYAASIASSVADTTLIKRWTTRLMHSVHDTRGTARWIAIQFASTPMLRAEGIARLRGELDSLAELSPSERALDETLSKQRDRHAATRRRLLATLGQALVATGNYSAVREALAEAASTGWNLDVFRAVRTASLAAGDTARALTIAARIAVDPRTPPAFTDSVRPLAERHFGAAGWRSQFDSARSEYIKRMLADASARSLSNSVRVRDLDGRAQSLSDLTNGQVTVVAFWSRFCGPAVEDLPRLDAVAARLAHAGVHVVSIVDEPRSSNELKAFLKEKHVTVPVHLDTWHDASRAFNQWGTPSYYVVDTGGRIRFDATNSAAEVLARAEAQQLSGMAVAATRVAAPRRAIQ